MRLDNSYGIFIIVYQEIGRAKTRRRKGSASTYYLSVKSVNHSNQRSPSFKQPPPTPPWSDFVISLNVCVDVIHCLRNTISKQHKFQIIPRNRLLACHKLEVIPQFLEEFFSIDHDRKLGDGSCLNQCQNLKQLIHGTKSAWHNDEGVRILGQHCFPHKEMFECD